MLWFMFEIFFEADGTISPMHRNPDLGHTPSLSVDRARQSRCPRQRAPNDITAGIDPWRTKASAVSRFVRNPVVA